ncbi:efflux RND transporter periplasmic adaptor subunit [Roseimaritima ulvae]|uniref:HlyD family secretion protein n=1 Tax=Roseimaritima ulvae TaxID=980254 RepID=A0A5B9R1E3_9BACT|nr:efflux RND transporter periplasmic adaptor subunit [Roseimaritima ulvae]QEG40133.1 HlyD family secretion protein [Roseimaritima ulvae]
MTVNQQTIEETKQQIRVLVNEIAALTKSGATAEEFFPEFLQRVITALAAVGGAVWLMDEDQQPRLKYQINVGQSLLDDDTNDAIQHNRLINRVSRSGQSLIVPPYSGTADGEQEGNPTRYLLVMAPLAHEGKTDGLIEVFQRPDTAPETQKGYLKFLQQMCDLATEWLRGQKLRVFSDRQVLWQQADSFARAAHESLHSKETAFIIANEGRRLIGCDRVSVAIKKGRKCKVQSISGQDTIENRSNIVAALNLLATRVVAAGEPLWHDGTTEDLPPQIEEALEDYVDQSYGRNIAVLPLREPQRDDSKEETGAAGTVDRDNAHRGEVIGALIVEQIESDLPPDVFRARVNLVYEHGTRALANSLEHSNLFLMPLWRAIGKATWVLRARTLPKTLAVAGLILALILGLIFVPLELQLEAEGTLEPDVRQQVFANIDGEVLEVLVGHNSVVEEGQELLRLRNRELELQIVETIGQINTANADLDRITGVLTNNKDLKRAERDQLIGERSEAIIRLNSLNGKLDLLEEKQQSLTVRSPIRGRVLTWDVEKTLYSRPVTTGQVLLEVADFDQPMHLELNMPEKRMSHLDAAFIDSEASELEVEYILATDPDTTLAATLPRDSIELRAKPDQEEGNTVTMRATPDNDELLKMSPRPGAKVIADVQAGKKSAGYVVFHEVYEWLCKFFF